MKLQGTQASDAYDLSLPSWERGLKYMDASSLEAGLEVAPLVGAWIEIPSSNLASALRTVAPLVGAWIEISIPIMQRIDVGVAPLVGAWIEIYTPFCNIVLLNVAPLVGAWIEICLLS